MLILVTGATGKVGQGFIGRLLSDPGGGDACVRAPCHNRMIEETHRVSIAGGSIADRGVVAAAMEYDLAQLFDWAREYERASDDPRKVWYLG